MLKKIVNACIRWRIRGLQKKMKGHLAYIEGQYKIKNNIIAEQKMFEDMLRKEK